MNNDIIVGTGKTKRKIAWERNGMLGHIARMKNTMVFMQSSRVLSRSESQELDDVYTKLNRFELRLRRTKSSNVKVRPELYTPFNPNP